MPHDTRRLLLASGLTLSYGLLSQRVVPERAQLPANLSAAGALTVLARRWGRSWDELGLDPADAGRGIGFGATTVPVIAAVLGTAASIPALRGYLHNERVVDTSSSEAARKILVEVPLETALAEELLFRGALFALGSGADRPARATVWSSLVFGMWHVLPALHHHRSNPHTADATEPLGGALALVAGTVVATSAAGVGFAWLRVRSRSVLAPVIAHAALNSLAFLASRWVARRFGVTRDQ